MSTPTKILLGLVALAAFAVPVLSMGGMFYLFFYRPDLLFDWFMNHGLLVLVANLLLILLSYGPVVLYIILAGINPHLKDRKPVWILLIVLLGFIGIPLYWYLFVWQEGGYEA